MEKFIFSVPEKEKNQFDTWKVLILEDDLERMKYFKTSLGPVYVEITHVETAQECIEEMQKNKFDWIFLDHDLGGEIFVDTENKNTGSEVARWMSDNWDRFTDSEIIIHSYNQPAARIMQGYIPGASYVPGCWMGGLQLYHKRRDKDGK